MHRKCTIINSRCCKFFSYLKFTSAPGTSPFCGAGKKTKIFKENLIGIFGIIKKLVQHKKCKKVHDKCMLNKMVKKNLKLGILILVGDYQHDKQIMSRHQAKLKVAV